MSTTPQHQPDDPKTDPTRNPAAGESTRTQTPLGETTLNGEMPTMASAPDAGGTPLPDDVVDPAPDEPLASAIDGASRPDKVAIGLMVGVLVLLLICVAFGLAAR